LGLICGLACSVRFLGIIFPLVFMIIFIFKAYLLDEKINWKGFLIFCFSGLISLFIFFPTLWHHPIQSFLYVINSLSVFRWQGHVLLNGTQIKSTLLPWYYLPEWIAISTPISLLLACIAGIFLLIYKLKSLFVLKCKLLLFLTSSIVLMILPFVMVIILQSVVYDDWRHVYFIYPTMVLFAFFGVYWLKNKKAQLILSSIIFLELVISQFQLFPFQHVYFNIFVSKSNENIRHHFDYDYWGIAQIDALNYLLLYDNSDGIKIKYTTVLTNNKLLLEESGRKRLFLVDSSARPKYFITTYRNHPKDFNQYKLIYSKQIQGSSIYGIYKIQ